MLSRCSTDHELLERIGREGFAHEKSLERVAPAPREEVELRACPHTLGNDVQPEAAGEPDDRLGDRRIAGIGLEVGDERDVDLQRVDRKVLEVGQRRVAGAEVVDRDREPWARNSCSTLRIASRSCSRLVSVTSSSSHDGSHPARLTMSTIRCARSSR